MTDFYSPRPAACTACELHKTCKIVKVEGRGPENPDVLIVGSNPGPHEDIVGRAFVGPTGKFLDRCLADAGYRPQEVRFTNAVRCAPPDGRDAYPIEIETCRQHLYAEIHATRPRLIVALGDIALRALTKLTGIGEARGKSYPLHPDFGLPDIEVWPTFHAAYAMKPEGLHARQTIVSDLRRIRASSTPEDNIPWKKWEGQPLRGGLISFDIEAYDAEGNIVDYPTQIAIASKLDGVLVSHDVQGMTQALRMAQQAGAWTTGHNSHEYDVDMLRRHHIEDLAYGHDTMTLAYLDGEQQPRGLESVAVKYLGVRGWKEDDTEKKLGNIDDPGDRLARYNGQDAWYGLLVFETLWKKLGHKRQLLAGLLLALRLTLRECSARGLYVDAAEVARVKPIFEDAIEKQKARLIELAGDSWKDPDPKKPYKPDRVHNPGKSGMNDEVLRVALARGFEQFMRRTPKTGKLSLDKLALNTIVEVTGDEYAVAQLAYRHATKRKSTYVDPYEKATLTDDGRVHCLYTVDRTVTNRTSSKEPNTQNLERDLHFFIGGPGTYFVKGDLAAVEFRTGGWCGRESVIIENYRQNPNWDPHSWLAARMFNMTEDAIKAEHKAMMAQGLYNTKRQMAKSANFSQEFMGTPETLIDYCAKLKPPMFLSYEQANWIHLGFHNALPTFRSWWYPHTAHLLDQQGFIETATGFRRHFDGFSTLKYEDRVSAIRQAVNCQAQTLAAHIAYIGLVTLRQRGYPVNGFFHDAVSFEFQSRRMFEIAKPDIIDAMTLEPIRVLRQHFGVDFNVPLAVSFSVDE